MFDVDVRRQHQDGDVGLLLPYGPGRVEALGVVRRRHPDVGQHQRRLTFADHVEQLDAIARLPDDLETRPPEKAGKALAEQDVVISEDDAYGTHR